MLADSPNLNALWGDLIVEELVRNGVREFVIGPGSRSTPVALAAARHTKARVSVHFDERGGAFHALGLAKASRAPAAVITTSGTAVANAMPAVVEAFHAFVPLILLTADRPPEQIDTGANQTIRQTGIFGNHVQWEHAMPVPDLSVPPESVLTSIDQAVFRALGPESGPVHLNLPFREPLAPEPRKFDREGWLAPVSQWLRCETPYTRHIRPEAGHENADWLDLFRNTRRGLLIFGLIDDHVERASALHLVKELRWPVLPDPASGLRFKRGPAGMAHHFDAVLKGAQADVFNGAETIVHAGGPITSKSLNAWLHEGRFDHFLRVHPSQRRLDPTQRATQWLTASIDALRDIVKTAPDRAEPDKKWSNRILAASTRAGKALDKAFTDDNTLSEQWVVRTVAATVPKRAAMWLGNSLPIRHADHVAPSNGKCERVFANRGASGIDGNIAAAAGIARSLNAPVIAVVGDLAALHDLNSLALLNQSGVQMTIVVLNNDGGGIFHMLPVARYPEHFEQLFGTPHGRTFEQAAAMFHLDYAEPKSRRAFEKQLERAMNANKSGIIEIRTDREETAKLTGQLTDLLRG